MIKTFACACIQLHNYDLFEKAQLKISPLIQNHVQQDYLPESYARHLTYYQKCDKIVAPTKGGLFALPLNLDGKRWDGKISCPTAKNLLILPIIKISLNRFKCFSVKSLICFPSNSNFQVIIPCNLHL